mgnify:CR=1 FL=1
MFETKEEREVRLRAAWAAYSEEVEALARSLSLPPTAYGRARYHGTPEMDEFSSAVALLALPDSTPRRCSVADMEADALLAARREGAARAMVARLAAASAGDPWLSTGTPRGGGG